VRELGKVGEIRVATIDIDDKILVGIKDGIVLCGVSQQPYMQGFIPVVWLYLHKKYGFIPPEQVATGPAIIDLKTIDLIEHQLETTGGA
jgi:simple sugar transport system substrate-binding protein